MSLNLPGWTCRNPSCGIFNSEAKSRLDVCRNCGGPRKEDTNESELSKQVRSFHEKFGHPIGTKPRIPPEEYVRFRLRLITEEFFELLDACGLNAKIRHERLGIMLAISNSTLKLNLPEFIDALADMDYINSGTRTVLGVRGEPIANAVHEANMMKEPQLRPDGTPDPTKKPIKPEGWKAPDISALLEEQGWTRTENQNNK